MSRRANNLPETNYPLVSVQRFQSLKCDVNTRQLDELAQYISYVESTSGDKPTEGEVVGAALTELFKLDRGFRSGKLESLKRAQNEARLKLGSEWEHNRLVFASDCGSPLSLRNLQRGPFKPLLEKAKSENIRTYDLRHSCATLLLAADENPKVVSERLGHASNRSDT